MSVHTKFDHPANKGCLATAPAVLRFASFFPRALRRREMHDLRAGGDLSHIRHDLSPQNYRVTGDEDWIAVLIAEIAAAKRNNHINEIAAREAKGRWKEAQDLRRRGPVDPWKFTAVGPLREGILTVNKLWFGGTGPQEWDPERVNQFVSRGVEFLQTHFPDGQLREVTVHVDEEAVHLHFAVAVWNEKVSQNRGRQRLLQPSANPLLANYEHAQDLVGEAFLDIGIHRGERRAAAARAAKAVGLAGPSPRQHVPPSAWRQEQRRKALADRDQIREKTRAEAAQVRADAGLTAKATVKKSRKRAIRQAREKREQADQVMLDAQIALKRGHLAESFRRVRIKKLAEKTAELERRRSEQAARVREIEARALMLHRETAQAEARAQAARQAQAEAEADRVEEERRAEEAAQAAEAHEARAAEATARVEAVSHGLVALSEGIKARALHEGDADDLKRIAAPVRAAYPEIAPAVAAAHTFLGAINSVHNDTAAVAQSTLAERAEAMAEIAQAQVALAEKQAEVQRKWAAADRLLQLLQPLIERMNSWLRRAELSAGLAEKGEMSCGMRVR